MRIASACEASGVLNPSTVSRRNPETRRKAATLRQELHLRIGLRWLSSKSSERVPAGSTPLELATTVGAGSASCALVGEREGAEQHEGRPAGTRRIYHPEATATSKRAASSISSPSRSARIHGDKPTPPTSVMSIRVGRADCFLRKAVVS